MKITTNFIKQTKRHLSASGSILLPLALKWRLVTVTLYALAASTLPTIISSSAHAASLTISIPKNPLTVNVSANTNGGFSTASGKLTVSGDAAWGYTLTVKSGNEDNSNNLKTNDDKKNILPSISNATDAAGIIVNHWGYMPSKLNSNPNTQYLPGPTSEETTIDKTNTATDVTGTTYDFTLAAKVDATQPAGTYSGSFTFTAVANAVRYNIDFDANGGDSAPDAISGETQEATVALSNQEPTKADNNFLGWCTVKPTNDNIYSEDTCPGSGKSYEKGAEFDLANSDNKVTLYAMWQKHLTLEQIYELNGKTKYNNTNYYAMQDMGVDFCKHVGVPSEQSTTTLIDTRDNKTYTVAKLLDGECWMTQNLAIGSNEEETTLTPEKSDIAEEFVLPQGNQRAICDEDKSGWCISQYDVSHIYIDTTYGGYYTWFAATVGEGMSIMPSKYTKHSICSKNWRLPTHDELRALSMVYDAITSQQAPANFIRPGKCGSADCPGSKQYGYWWSSVSSSVDYAYYLRSYNDESFHLDSWGDNKKGSGFSVRCVAR